MKCPADCAGNFQNILDLETHQVRVHYEHLGLYSCFFCEKNEIISDYRYHTSNSTRVSKRHRKNVEIWLKQHVAEFVEASIPECFKATYTDPEKYRNSF